MPATGPRDLASCYLARELGDAPLPDATSSLEMPHDVHTDLKASGAFWCDTSDGQPFRMD